MISKENLRRGITALSTLELQTFASRDRIEILASRNRTKALRFQAGLDLLDKVIPARTIAKKLSSLTWELPLSTDRLSLISYGYEHNVYRIDGHDLVLKVDRNSLLSSRSEQEEIAKKRNQACEVYKQFFGHLPGFVTPEYFFVSRSPILLLPAVHAIQRFLPQNYVDFFTQRETLPERLKQVPLRQSFLSFYSAFNSMLASGLCPDLCGNNNLVITRNPHGEQLMFTEGHSTFTYADGMIDDSRLKNNGGDKMFQERINFIQFLAQGLTESGNN